MTHKQILKGHEARLKIKAGIDKACDAVRPTLGAVGMTAIIEYPGLDPIECDDGVTILKNLEFKDHYENMGLQMLRKAAVRTSSEGGDGTATTTVLTQALVNEAFKEIANDSSKIREVGDRLKSGLENVLVELGKLKRDVTQDDIERIATISSLDPEVAKIIAEIIKEVGVNGVVTVEKGSKIGYTKEVVKGARFDRGLISPYFINEPEAERCVIENPYIVIVDRKISTNEQITSIMTSIQDSKNLNVLFIADDVDSLALATFIQNSINVNVMDPATRAIKKGTFNVACVRNPYNSSRARDFLSDIAALTGGTVISEQAGMRLDEANISLLGKADKVVITKDTTTIVGFRQSEELDARVKAIEAEIDSTTSEYSKMMLEERLAQLTGGIGVVRVGTYTDTEFNAKKYKFENAINSTQAALHEGIIAGGGTSLYEVSKRVTEPMFKKALIAPITQMAENAGMFGSSFFTYKFVFHKNKLLSYVVADTGYNFKNKSLVNMFDEGIIDPFKVTRLALESAVAIASSLICIETAITLVDDPKGE